jgi:hypothetical protein
MGSNSETPKLQYTWVLWYHDPEVKDYSLKSYIKISDFTTPQQFWTVIDAIPKEAWECGMYFFMRKGYNPLWESPEHKEGGAWSKKIDASQAHTSFIDLMVHCISDELLMNRKETLAGISISPKGQFHIIKLWNTTTTVSDKKYLNQNLTYFKVTDDVVYTPHNARPT